MKNKLYTIAFAILGLLIGANVTNAQHVTSLKYNVGFPTADLGDYIEKTSWRGVSFDYTYFINNNLGFGVGFAWQTFYEDVGFTTHMDETETFSGYEYRYLNSFPMHATVTYRHEPYSTMSPFASLGVGTTYNIQDTDIGIFRFNEEAWHFSVRPEIGVQFNTISNTSIQFSVRYNYAPPAGDLDNMSYLALALGFAWEQY